MPRYRLLALLLLTLAGCADPGPVVGSVMGANLVSVMLIGRDIPDAVVSTVTGRDCSIVRLDKGLSYCRLREPPLAPAPYCTKSIGAVDCWRQAPLTMPPTRGVADQALMLTPAQEANRVRRWPGLW
jgi:predicted small lipoprotein YifL